MTRLRPEQFHRDHSARKTVAYARVSSHDQTEDLEGQKQVLELYCARQGWTFEVAADLRSVGWSLPTKIGCCGSAQSWWKSSFSITAKTPGSRKS
ncbi:MAG: recombinase family protein [Sulfobacillus sp.]